MRIKLLNHPPLERLSVKAEFPEIGVVGDGKYKHLGAALACGMHQIYTLNVIDAARGAEAVGDHAVFGE